MYSLCYYMEHMDEQLTKKSNKSIVKETNVWLQYVFSRHMAS